MQLARIPVETSNLCIGMYVAKLDRPWLETPFVFQGFVIKDRVEIELLQTHCSVVFVDVDKGKLTEAEIRALAARSSGEAVRRVPPNRQSARGPGIFGRLAIRMGLGALFSRRKNHENGIYEVSATVRREAPKAREAWEKAVRAYRNIFDRTRRTGTVDVEQVRKVLAPMVESILRNPDAMAWTVFSGKRSGRKYCRAVATSVWSVMFGRHLGLDRQTLDELALGGLLLDIGNTSLADGILNAEGAITHDEYAQVPLHVQAGIDILSRSVGVGTIAQEMVAHHHERFDGSGYPNGGEGSTIPMYGRIAGIVDCYDAMTTKNNYSPALAAYDAARELNELRNVTFHGEVVEQFLQTIGMFPTGSVVGLSNGSVALVLEQNRDNPLQPKVLVLLDAGGSRLDKPKIVNPGDWHDKSGANLWIARGHEHGAFGIDPADHFA